MPSHPLAIQKIMDILEATFGSTAELRHESQDGPAVVIKPRRLSFAVFFAEEFVEDYPESGPKLSQLADKIKTSATHAVRINDKGDIDDFKTDFVFVDRAL